MSEGTRTMGGAWWVVVTGASQGLGATICAALAPLMAPGSKFLGIARSRPGLEATANSVRVANPNIKFTPIVMDLSTANTDEMESVLGVHLNVGQQAPPTQAIIFHNAGSLGPLKYLRDIRDHSVTTSYFNMNVSSVILLNSVFLELTSKLPNTAVKVVNISSLCALQPMKSWGLYCTAKASRDMLFQVLAAEEPNIRVLNYAPGPLDTDMQVKARTESEDKEIRDMFNVMKEECKLLTCEGSVKKLLQVLEKDEFKSGDHIDYYDV